MKIEGMSLGPLGTNCYILYNDKDALIVDPGGESGRIINFLNEINTKPHAILLTHAHFDHIGAVEELRYYYQLDVYLHELEADWLEDPHQNGSISFIGNKIQTAAPDHYLQPGILNVASFSCEVIHTPGHSPGSVSFVFGDVSTVIGGDVLFQRGIGRTDLPGGNIEQLRASIRYKLYTLSDEFTVFPGHGPITTIGDEKRHNPFVRS
ncbi:MBL fold metallo-hydrolase [Oceanobacillus halotolerans]|uniref:MBL fold metallo-hydrolase n=1 Tax=Oceanobacillus halotolerans TaxID=2663380 RepID=UPI0013DBED45|nr:MBL fold metallo-hydrolase [Oceanobacillus halotolerans]